MVVSHAVGRVLCRVDWLRGAGGKVRGVQLNDVCGPPAAIFTCGFDPLRGAGVEYASKLDEAGIEVTWDYFDMQTHGFLQLAPWSDATREATRNVGDKLKKISQ